MNNAQMMAALAMLPDPDLMTETKLDDPIGAGTYYRADTVARLLQEARDDERRKKEKIMRPAYWEIVDALVGMACQHLECADGKLDIGCVSADEQAFDVLQRLGLVNEGELLLDAFNHEWLQAKFPGA